MTPALLAALLAPLLTAFLLLDASRWAQPLPLALRLGLAVPLGHGLAALSYLAARLAGGGPAPLVLLEAAALALALLLRRRRAPLPPLPATAPAGAYERGLIALVAIAAGAAALAFAANAIDNPHGEWDAWAIWNLRARFLARGAPLAVVFDATQVHADYPPLLPAAVARLWSLAGEGLAAPLALAALSASATVLVLYGAVRALRDRPLALLAALALLGTPAFVTESAWQYADIPLALAFLASLALLAVHDREPALGSAALLWGGAAAGCAALIKNEGALFLVALFAVRALAALRDPRPRAAWFGWLLCAVGAAPFVAVLLAFKLGLAPANYLFEGGGAAAFLDRLIQPSRYRMIGAAAVIETVRFGGLLLIALTAAAVLLGGTSEPQPRRAAARVAGTVALMVGGYLLVYLVTPLDLSWQLRFSLQRLLLQLWPSALLALFLAVRSPERWRR